MYNKKLLSKTILSVVLAIALAFPSISPVLSMNTVVRAEAAESVESNDILQTAYVKLNDLGFANYLSIVLADGVEYERCRFEVDGAEITPTKVSDTGSVLKWELFSYQNRALTVHYNGKSQTVVFNSQGQGKKPYKYENAVQPKWIWSSGTVNIFDFHSSGYDDSGKKIEVPVKTTFDVLNSTGEKEEEIEYFVNKAVLDSNYATYGPELMIKFKLTTDKAKAWFKNIKHVARMAQSSQSIGSDDVLNYDRNLPIEFTYGNDVGFLNIYGGQSALRRAGMNYIRVVSGNDAVVIPVEIFNPEKPVLIYNNTIANPKVGEDFKFKVEGVTQGLALQDEFIRVAKLKRPVTDNSFEQETIDLKFGEIGLIHDLLIVDKKVTTKAGIYELEIGFRGYETVKIRFEILPNNNKPIENPDNGTTPGGTDENGIGGETDNGNGAVETPDNGAATPDETNENGISGETDNGNGAVETPDNGAATPGETNNNGSGEVTDNGTQTGEIGNNNTATESGNALNENQSSSGNSGNGSSSGGGSYGGGGFSSGGGGFSSGGGSYGGSGFSSGGGAANAGTTTTASTTTTKEEKKSELIINEEKTPLTYAPIEKAKVKILKMTSIKAMNKAIAKDVKAVFGKNKNIKLRDLLLYIYKADSKKNQKLAAKLSKAKLNKKVVEFITKLNIVNKKNLKNLDKVLSRKEVQKILDKYVSFKAEKKAVKGKATKIHALGGATNKRLNIGKNKGNGGSSGSSGGGSMGTIGTNGEFLFDYDMLVNALLLQELKLGNVYSNRIATMFSTEVSAHRAIFHEGGRLYDYGKFVTAVKNRKFGGIYMDYNYYTRLADETDILKGSSNQLTIVLDNGALGKHYFGGMSGNPDVFGGKLPEIAPITIKKGQDLVFDLKDDTFVKNIKIPHGLMVNRETYSTSTYGISLDGTQIRMPANEIARLLARNGGEDTGSFYIKIKADKYKALYVQVKVIR